MAKRILVVDDEVQMRQIIQTVLRKEELEFDQADDGQAAIDKLKAASYDLVILDIIMPGVDGIAVLKYIRQTPETANIPVVMLTGRTQDGSVLEAYKSGANYYITKPFEFKDLVDIVELILGVDYGG